MMNDALVTGSMNLFQAIIKSLKTNNKLPINTIKAEALPVE